MDIVITEFRRVKQLVDSEYLFRFFPKDVRFVITWFSMDALQNQGDVSMLMLSSLRSKGFLEIVDLDEAQNLLACQIYSANTHIVFESIAALVYAQHKRLPFMTEDSKVMDFAYRNFEVPDVISSGKLDRHLKDTITNRDKKFKSKQSFAG
jgi:hypothetical protein